MPDIAVSGLEGKQPLAHRRQHRFRWNPLIDRFAEPKAIKPRAGQNHCIKRIFALKSAEPRRHVPTQWHEFEIRSIAPQERHPPRAPRSDSRAFRQIVKARASHATAKRVAGILSLRVGCNHAARSNFRRHILRAMHGDIRATVEERFLDLFHEEPLAADLGEGAILNSVAGRAQYDELRHYAELSFDTRGDMLGLR